MNIPVSDLRRIAYGRIKRNLQTKLVQYEIAHVIEDCGICKSTDSDDVRLLFVILSGNSPVGLIGNLRIWTDTAYRKEVLSRFFKNNHSDISAIYKQINEYTTKNRPCFLYED